MNKLIGLIPYKVFPPNTGGQRGIVLLYRALSTKIKITTLTIDTSAEKENFEIIPIMENKKSRYADFFLFNKIKKIAKQQQATHLLFEHPYFAWLIFLFRKFTSFTVILHSHNIESERFKEQQKWWWKILWYYEKWAFNNAHAIWLVTSADKQYAVENFNVNEKKCLITPYGTEQNHLPSLQEIEDAKNYVFEKHTINSKETILLFNGALSYKPNYDAVQYIVEKLNPILLQSPLQYKIVICGKGLPTSFNNLETYKNQNIIYAGFVEDISIYFKACDVFLNPTIEGGGIKTKLVEALGFGKYCVSSENGAIGVDEKYTQGRLKIVGDNDWLAFANAIIHIPIIENNNQLFYDNFSWNNIAQKALISLQ